MGKWGYVSPSWISHWCKYLRGEESPKEGGEIPYVFPAGLGTALMNGCWGSGYKETDPCYSAKWKSSICQVNEHPASWTVFDYKQVGI